MSKTNPKASIEAMFPKSIDCGFGVEVKPLTLGHYALLEKIDSYLVNGEHKPDSIEVIKTFYICTHDSKQILESFSNLEEESFKWAETLPPGITTSIANAILKQIDAMANVIPHIGEEGKKKVTPGTDFLQL